jgi:hypothetical protein
MTAEIELDEGKLKDGLYQNELKVASNTGVDKLSVVFVARCLLFLSLFSVAGFILQKFRS